MKFFNRQFGELEFNEAHIIYFPNGLIGFEENKKFLIVNDDDSQPFRWLVSLENENLNFPILDPTLIVPDYQVGTTPLNGQAIFVIAVLGDHIEKSTVNLRSPVVIDETNRHGRQVVLDDDTLPMQYYFIPAITNPVEE
jgi:flagellar assembly factor FliW